MTEENGRAKGAGGYVKGRREDGRGEKERSRVVPHPKQNPGCATDLMSHFKAKMLKCTKFDFGWGSAPDRTGELTALPQTPSWI